jgi:hypothetical protein
MMNELGRVLRSKWVVMCVFLAIPACGGQTIASDDAGTDDATRTHGDAASETGEGEDGGCEVPYPGVQCGKPCTIPGYSCSPGGPGDPIGWGCRIEPGASGPTWFCSEG